MAFPANGPFQQEGDVTLPSGSRRLVGHIPQQGHRGDRASTWQAVNKGDSRRGGGPVSKPADWRTHTVSLSVS